MKRDFLIALNIKNNLIDEKVYFENLKESELKSIIFPSFLQLKDVFFDKNRKIELGVQDLQIDNLTITGEVKACDLKQFDVKYSIVGHSERRYKLFETSEVVSKKITESLDNKITPVLCVGELEQTENIKLVFEFLDSQIKESLGNCFNRQKDIILAYEPVFAIGTGVSCDIEHIESVIDYIKDNYNFNEVLYGGSVNVNNCKEIYNIKNLDGFLIGSASLDYNKINKIYDLIENEK
ncbi:MAG: triosephosphate isomerase [Clostridiales bacterium]|nr:triosephosphate isomerase [Candidatus Apopatousia equi]